MLWLLMLSMYLLAIDNILHDFALLYDLNLYSLNFEKVFKLSIRICSRMVNLGLALMTIGFKIKVVLTRSVIALGFCVCSFALNHE